MDTPKPNKAKPQSGKAAPAAPPSPAPAPASVPPLFRKIDWLALVIAFAAIWIAYLYTLAPDLTLEDSGELCTASFYAGIPHPPGYPFWSIYSYLWTLLPFGSVTWRVEVGESFAAAMACGLVGLMVSRGSSMLIEGLQELKEMDRKWENAICIVCGVAAGLLLGFDDFMWKESVVVNRISLFDVPWLMLVAVCLLRWIYAPQQRRYLYFAMFFFGLCATIHQTMLVAAMGIEVAIAMASPKLGRDFFLWNGLIYLLGLVAMGTDKFPALSNLDPMFLGIFHFVGLGSIAACIWLAIQTGGIFLESKIVLIAGICYALGAAFYLYEPVSGMTDPPMQWGYPRTVEGFFHAISRGQYDKAHPTNLVADPMRFVLQLGILVSNVADSFSWVGLFVALVPFLFIFKMQKRELAWIIGLTALYFCVGILLTIVMNTTPDRQTADEAKVFFTASHAIVAVMMGYGFALLAAYMSTHYTSFRTIALAMGLVTLLPTMVELYDSVSTTFYGGVGLLDYVNTLLLFLCMVAAFILTALGAQRFLKVNSAGAATGDDKFFLQAFISAAVVFLGFAGCLAFLGKDRLGIHDVLASLPRIFAPHQFNLPVVGALLLLAAVVVFIGSVWAYRGRAPVAITLGLILLLPVSSGISHWAKGEQRNHWFGYWFGHDMFTPPFVGPDNKFSYDAKLREQMMKGKDGDMVYPEMERNTILFGGTDPGRFCPTYMIFCESFVPAHCKPMDPVFDRRDVYLITQNALADGTYLDYLRAQYFRSAQIDPPFFREFLKPYWKISFIAILFLCGVWIAIDFLQENRHRNRNAIIIGSALAVIIIIVGAQKDVPNAAYNMLDKPLTKFGKNVEDRRRAEGVYPPKEIYIPSDEDLSQSFRTYSEDAANRKQQGRLQPGEDIQIDEMGRVQASGQVSVMMINGILCKVIFDHNPTNAFYVEESFPLEWMYPYETPYGIIMKINRDPIVTLPDDVYKRDHAFWSRYSERFIGNWITTNTTVAEITNFVEKVYLQHDYNNFKGDLKFLRDTDAQKAFSKLRDSQAGMYAWRLRLLIPNAPIDPQYQQYRPKSEAEVQKLRDEADFAFKQSFAFCPYSPETVIRYVNFLFQFNRFDDAYMVARTCLLLDPYNPQMIDLVKQIADIQKQIAAQRQAMGSLEQMETEARQHPANIPNLLSLGGTYYEMQQTDKAVEMFDKAIASPSITYNEAAGIADFYSKLAPNYLDKLEGALEKLAVLAPDQPEAHYDLAALKAYRGEKDSALAELQKTMDLNAKRLKKDPHAKDIAAAYRSDPRFTSVRSLPEFQKIAPTQ